MDDREKKMKAVTETLEKYCGGRDLRDVWLCCFKSGDAKCNSTAVWLHRCEVESALSTILKYNGINHDAVMKMINADFQYGSNHFTAKDFLDAVVAVLGVAMPAEV